MIASRKCVAPSQRSSTVAASSAAASRSLAVSSRLCLTGYRDVNTINSSMPTSKASGAPRRLPTTMMGNKSTGGPFAPLVVVTRNLTGEKEFNKIRGKAIALHSQVIKDFSKQLGVDPKQVQGIIRLAKKNGEKLGFLA